MVSFLYFTRHAPWTIDLLSGIFFTIVMIRSVYLTVYALSLESLNLSIVVVPITQPAFLTLYMIVFLVNSNYSLTQYFVIPVSSITFMLVAIIQSKGNPSKNGGKLLPIGFFVFAM